jgi:hypothetical protein
MSHDGSVASPANCAISSKSTLVNIAVEGFGLENIWRPVLSCGG